MVEATNNIIDSAVEAVSWLNWTHGVIFCMIIAVVFAVLAVIFEDQERWICALVAIFMVLYAAVAALGSYSERNKGQEDTAAQEAAYVQPSEQDTGTLWEMEGPDEQKGLLS